MKLKNVNNLEAFFEAVNKCSGDVYLTTNEGDRLNLKSQLTKYLALATICENSLIAEMNLEVSNSSDLALLMDYSLKED